MFDCMSAIVRKQGPLGLFQVSVVNCLLIAIVRKQGPLGLFQVSFVNCLLIAS